jgi:hypothetical protein
MQVWQTGPSERVAMQTHRYSRRLTASANFARTFCARRCRTPSIAQSARSCKRSSRTGTDRPQARSGSITRAARKGGTHFIVAEPILPPRRSSPICALFHPRPQRSAVARCCFFTQPERRISSQAHQLPPSFALPPDLPTGGHGRRLIRGNGLPERPALAPFGGPRFTASWQKH